MLWILWLVFRLFLFLVLVVGGFLLFAYLSHRRTIAKRNFHTSPAGYKAWLDRQPVADLRDLPFDPRTAKSVHDFRVVQQTTLCIFARAARVWGNEYLPELSVKQNAQRCVKAFAAFMQTAKSQQLEGFAYQILLDPETPQEFGALVRDTLRVLSEGDPKKRNCMGDCNRIGYRGWCFEFGGDTIFITTFASCYPRSHVRYVRPHAGGCCWILLQPEFSFVRHDLPLDSPHTNWDNPQTVRDRIRVAFRNAGRPYYIRPTIRFSPADEIVKPEVDDGTVMKWWEDHTT